MKRLRFVLTVAVLGFALSIPPAYAADWWFEALDGAGTGSSGGQTSNDVGQSTASLTYGGLPHVFYWDQDGGNLRHAWWTGSAWFFETLDGHQNGPNGQVDADVGFFASAAVYGTQLHVWYQNLSGLDVRHGWWTGSTWLFETLDGQGGDNGRTTNAVGEDLSTLLYAGTPHIWYHDDTDGALRHGWWTGSTWWFETLDGNGGSNGRTNSDVGAYAASVLYANQPHVWYYNEDDRDLRHAWWTGSTWWFETLDGHQFGPNGETMNWVGAWTSVVLYQGRPHVFYHRQKTVDFYLRHAWWTGSTWYFEDLDGDGGPNGRTSHSVGRDSAALSFQGVPHVWYQDIDAGAVRHAWWSGSAWWFETLDGIGGGNGSVTYDVGYENSATLYAGMPHVWYYDFTNGHLRHGWYG